MTINDIIRGLGGPGAFAAAIGVKPSAASMMRRRGSIPVRYWPRLVAAAEKKGGDTVTYGALVALHARDGERDKGEGGLPDGDVGTPNERSTTCP